MKCPIVKPTNREFQLRMSRPMTLQTGLLAQFKTNKVSVRRPLIWVKECRELKLVLSSKRFETEAMLKA
jgi:hypothetical protein